MRRRAAVLVLAAAALAAGPSLIGSAAAEPPELAPGAHPGASWQASSSAAYHYARGQGASRAAKPISRVTMTYHGGKVLQSAVTKAIFWGPSWGSSGFASDKITGLNDWYTGYNGSNYAKTSTEYTDGANNHVGSATSHSGSVTDLSTASGGGSTSAILGEVARRIPNPVANGYYAVYTDLPRGNAGYCAWHSYGTIGSTPVQFAFFWNLDGDPGCDPQDTTTGHSQGLAALANVTGHELAEAMTDPALNAWYDASGAENGDKCAWTFNVPAVTFSNGTAWKIQGEWSNAAYGTPKAYPNGSGQLGCVDGRE